MIVGLGLAQCPKVTECFRLLPTGSIEVLLQLRDASLVLRSVPPTLTVGDPLDGILHCLERIPIIPKKDDGKRRDFGYTLLEECLENAQGSRGVAGHEDSLTRGEEVANEIDDRVGLAGAWGALDQHALARLQALYDLLLSCVGCQREVDLLDS